MWACWLLEATKHHYWATTPCIRDICPSISTMRHLPHFFLDPEFASLASSMSLTPNDCNGHPPSLSRHDNIQLPTRLSLGQAKMKWRQIGHWLAVYMCHLASQMVLVVTSQEPKSGSLQPDGTPGCSSLPLEGPHSSCSPSAAVGLSKSPHGLYIIQILS